MTTRKENLRLPPRTPASVDRETGAAEFCVSPETWDRWEKEGRAALIEYDGGITRTWAEALARLDPACPPCDIPPERGLRFIDDCGRFLDDGWAPCAEALGWTPLDLFGCDRAKPFARFNRAGLVWLLDGQKLLAANGAAIAAPSDGNQMYWRCMRESGGVLARELPDA